ncbi:hypothetical protein [Teredinibacter turnerae]|uniref:hypothetical protein n=1 Tax=Teredinibacter turnerae TaxID=2426 RepID=UPI00048B0034|nr:hypothetical protein [Teredinibacter turnerae]
MGFIEILIFLIAPTLEIVLPIAFYLVEAVVWLLILLFYLLIALFSWSKPKIPAKYSLTKARGKVKSAAVSWRSYMGKRGNKDKNS